MIAVIDYGVGNLFSLESSLKAIGAEAVRTRNADAIRAADKLILPGVGAFGDAAAILRETGLMALIRAEAGKGKPLLGVCLGMQLLFEESLEYGKHEGLGLIPGTVVSIRPLIPAELKVPQIGWNALSFPRESKIMKNTKVGQHVYFVHSYHAAGCETYTCATTDYGTAITAAVERGNVMGTQFHPEKSGAVGLDILRAFCEVSA
jgi:glutamine amidotransferase